jgi:guanyl-specific ribonuclease Sa
MAWPSRRREGSPKVGRSTIATRCEVTRPTIIGGISLPFVLGVLVVLGLFHAPLPLAIGDALVTGPVLAAGPATSVAPDVEVPEKAREVLAEIQKRKGEPLPGYIGGRTFANRERRLPRGNYREYDVNPKKPGKSRGAERIVIEQRTGKAYYSRDHYETFTPMN